MSLVAQQVAGDAGAAETRSSPLFAPAVVLTGHSDDVLCGSYSPNGELFVSGDKSGTLIWWNGVPRDQEGSMCVGAVPLAHNKAITSLSWAKDGVHFATGSADGKIKLWDSVTFECVAAYPMRFRNGSPAVVNDVCFSLASTGSNTELMVSADDNGEVRFWNPRKSEAVAVYAEKYPVLSVCSFEHRVFAGGFASDLTTYTASGRVTDLKMGGHVDMVTGVAVASEGREVVSYCLDGTLRRFNAQPFCGAETRLVGQVFGELPRGAQKLLFRVSGGHNGSVVVGAQDGRVRVFSAKNLASGAFGGHKGAILDVSVHPTHPIIASVSADGSIIMGEV